jgi:hypothetical protein
MIIPEQYINIGGVDMSDDIYPNYYKPLPTSKDYLKGYINRYFVQKINDLTITEVNKNKYNDIYTNYFNKLVIQWIISGPKNNVYKNKILDRKGVQEQNIEILNISENKMTDIKNYLNNPLEFWGGK